MGVGRTNSCIGGDTVVNYNGYRCGEVFDETVRSVLEPLSVARRSVAATDGNGNVLFGGGYGDSAIVDKYTKDGVHSVLEPLSKGKHSLAAATDGNGNVLFGGGFPNSASAIVDKYTKDGVHSVLEPLSLGRGDLAAATDGNGNVLFGGGYRDSAIVDKYTKDGVHSVLEPLSLGRSDLAAATDGNGNVLFGGGGVSDSYFAIVDKYTKDGVHSVLEPLSESRKYLAAATNGNGNVLFGGGSVYGSGSASYSAIVDKYTKDGVHGVIASLSKPTQFPSASTDRHGNILFMAVGNTNYHVVNQYANDGSHKIFKQYENSADSLAAATDGNGNVLFGGFYGVEKYTPGKAELPLYAPIGSKFKEAGGVEQVFTSNKQIVKSPFNGYIKFKKGDINYV